MLLLTVCAINSVVMREQKRERRLLPVKTPIKSLTFGGGCEIRTHEDREALPVFKTGAFNRSANPPRFLDINPAGFSSGRASRRLTGLSAS